MKYWLMKSEPDVYGIDALAADGTTRWDGVRNYQARNFMRDEMKPGDLVLFYHSNAEPSGIAGLAEISAVAAPDQTQFDKKSEYYDPKAKPNNPPWVCPEVRFVQKFARVLSLDELRAQSGLAKMPLLQKGQRLSVQPVSKAEYELILQLAEGAHAGGAKAAPAKAPTKNSALKTESIGKKTKSAAAPVKTSKPAAGATLKSNAAKASVKNTTKEKRA